MNGTGTEAHVVCGEMRAMRTTVCAFRAAQHAGPSGHGEFPPVELEPLRAAASAAMGKFPNLHIVVNRRAHTQEPF